MDVEVDVEVLVAWRRDLRLGVRSDLALSPSRRRVRSGS